jgi:alpha-glucosidase
MYRLPFSLLLAGAMLAAGEPPLPKAPAAVTRIDPPEAGFFTKVVNYGGLPIKGGAAVADQALFEAWRRMDRQLRSNPVILANLVQAGAEFHVIGKDQVTSDLPEWRWAKGKLYDGVNDIDVRTRGMGGLLSSCGEENLLNLPGDRYQGRDICCHEFAHALYGFGFSANVQEEVKATYAKAMAKGLWKPAYASTNEDEYFAEMTMWYFGNHGDMRTLPAGAKAEAGPAWLKAYDPEGYALVEKVYTGKADVRKVVPANH